MSETQKLLNTVESAIFLGVTRACIALWFHQGRFPNAFKAGRAIRIPLRDIEAMKQRPGRRAV